MGFLGQEFDVQNDLPQGGGGYDPIPAGWYTAKITAAELKDTKAGTGNYINVRYDVLGPSHQGRVIFGMITVRNANQKAEEIGRQNLGDLCRAIGVAKIRDTDQLVGGTCEIKVGIRKSDEYGDQNEVKGWKSLNGGAMPKPSSPQQPSPASSSASSASAPPWARKVETQDQELY